MKPVTGFPTQPSSGLRADVYGAGSRMEDINGVRVLDERECVTEPSPTRWVGSKGQEVL